MMRFELTTRSYNRASSQFDDCVTTGYDQVLEADTLEEARRDYLHWLISQGYFIDHGIPEELQEEAIVISEAQKPA